MDCSLPGSWSMRFSRQEYWSRLPFPSPKAQEAPLSLGKVLSQRVIIKEQQKIGNIKEWEEMKRERQQTGIAKGLLLKDNGNSEL